MVNVFTYLDYRKFLKDRFDEMKEARSTFSHRSFAKSAGFRSSNYILLIMQGKRNLSSEAIIKVAKALKLKKKEAEFFENLVRFDQSKMDAEKNFYYEKIATNRQYADARPLEKGHYKYYSHWYIPVIREMVLLDDFQDDPKWIAQNITPHITIQEARDALDVLLEIGLVERGSDGKLIQSDPHLTSGDEVQNLNIANFQREMIQLAARSIGETKPKEREIGSVTFAVSKENLPEVKKMIREFRSRLAGFLAD
ncbi:MAG: TIGR02147 family protein, partial [Deltaproteobacteria bacterium]|nr:TIGR02147 family protein [Deltaproteobacteria bacterium]